MEPSLWPALLDAMPRVVSLSIDSNSRQNAAIMMDWAALNGGRFRRVIGALGLADGMDMAMEGGGASPRGGGGACG